MTHIEIQYPHQKTISEAHDAIDQMGARLKQKFGLSATWEQQSLHLAGSGIEGKVDVLDDKVCVTAQLGFPLSAMQAMIETEIKRELSKKLD